MIVDDETHIRHLIRAILQKHFPDIFIEEAGEGFHAGWIASGFGPDLIILDLNLPGLNGFQACQFIRSLEFIKNFPALQRTRILAITGSGNESRDQILNLGADDFLTKPFNNETLIRKVETQIHGPHFTGQA